MKLGEERSQSCHYNKEKSIKIRCILNTIELHGELEIVDDQCKKEEIVIISNIDDLDTLATVRKINIRQTLESP